VHGGWHTWTKTSSSEEGNNVSITGRGRAASGSAMLRAAGRRLRRECPAHHGSSAEVDSWPWMELEASSPALTQGLATPEASEVGVQGLTTERECPALAMASV
jgi:hypothetical protein